MNISNLEFNYGHVEIADDFKTPRRAIITIPLMHVGRNKKNVYWSSEVLQEISSGFTGVVFKYDVGGQSRGGSSHVPEHLFSPHYDVGWTTSSWFDGQTLWVKGEVTHPEAVDKLTRETSDGRKELDAASMGVFLDYNKVKCSICGRMPFESCEHKRGIIYNGKVCGPVPQLGSVTKKLHVALTNSPADTEAHIKDVLLQEDESFFKKKKNSKEGEKKMVEDNNNEKKKPEEDKKKPEMAQEEDKEKKKEKKEMAQENNNNGGKKMVTCPKCGAKIAVESAQEIEGIPAPAPKEKKDAEPKEGSLPKVSNTDDETTKQNRSVIDKPKETETADYSGKYKGRLVESIKGECKRTGRNIAPEFASMDIAQLETVEQVLKGVPNKNKPAGNDFEGATLDGFGKPGENKEVIEVSDMTPNERAAMGDFAQFDLIFHPDRYSR